MGEYWQLCYILLWTTTEILPCNTYKFSLDAANILFTQQQLKCVYYIIVPEFASRSRKTAVAAADGSTGQTSVWEIQWTLRYQEGTGIYL